MSTTLVSREGGADRVGLDNLLGTNNHPMNGLAYNQSLLGGSLMGVLPLTEGRYACFFREYNYAQSGEMNEGKNRVLVVSTVSGNSRVVEIGVEDSRWISFDSSGAMGYLLIEENDIPMVVILQANIDTVNALSTIPTPKATKENGEDIQFDSGISSTGGWITLASVVEGELYISRRPQTGTVWEYLSDNTYRQSSRDLRPQQSTSGVLKVREDVSLVDINNTQHVFDYGDDNVVIYKKNRYGAWERHGVIEAPDVDGEIIGFCLVKGAPAYSDPDYRYTVPAVFSVGGEPISQHWVKASVN